MSNFNTRFAFLIKLLEFLNNYKLTPTEKHPYHIPDSSPWPFLAASIFFSLVLCLTSYFHHIGLVGFKIYVLSIFLFFIVYNWFLDIIIEATFEGHHTKKAKENLQCGMVLFIISETMFFFSFFWAYFYTSIAPSAELVWWPPLGIFIFDPFSIPLVNTAVLISSGISITWAHRSFIFKNRTFAGFGLSITTTYALIFTLLQAYEYVSARFSINDSIYGSFFYLCTGFHGFHIIVGSLLLFVALLRHVWYQFTSTHHTGFETSAWYWHFVDVVWLFLYLFLYLKPRFCNLHHD